MHESRPSLVTVGKGYRLRARIGRGGMGEVFEALDTATGQVVALKCLPAMEDASKRERATAHLKREFHTLCQLAHPRVVGVYDYGVDAERGPYYTMELLDGGDLDQRSPLGFREACAFARDICSALSTLHARRVVHRDLSPRNVRCTHDGRAKLIDFGAMAAMGPNKVIMGTAPMCAPEILRLQPLDARTDLYALGATLYKALTGRHAYPARTFQMLEGMWKQAPPPPSVYAAETPAALDALVLDLLQLDPAARPASAAEVIERLSTIAGLLPDEAGEDSQAYLSTPQLVGRESHLARIRKLVTRFASGRGSAMMVQGDGGMGHSRMLDACVIECKLAGATVARADASDARGRHYDVIRALLTRLLSVWPDAVPEPGSALSRAWPELRQPGVEEGSSRWPDEPLDDAVLQAELQDFVLALCSQRPLALVVDDLRGVDEASIASLALLAQKAPQHPLLLATSARSKEREHSLALGLLRKISRRLPLPAFKVEDSERLLRSVFGDVPHVSLLADRLHRIAAGRPRDLMQLAQHAVVQGWVSYHAGAWRVDAAIDNLELPENMLDAFVEQMNGLSEDARTLARAMATSDESAFDLDECGLLAGIPAPLETMRHLDELLTAGAVVPAADHYTLRAQAWVAALRASVKGSEVVHHLRLSEVFAKRGDRFRTAQQLLLGGEEQRALSLLVEFAEDSQARTDKDPSQYQSLMASLPPDWFAICERALPLFEKHGRTRRERFVLQWRVLGLVTLDRKNVRAKPVFLAVWDQLSHDCGLDLVAQLDSELPAGERFQRAFAGAQERYDALPEHERVLPPGEAAGQLARAVHLFIGAVTSTLDLELWARLPSLELFAPLSPTVQLIQRLVDGVGLRLQGRNEAAREIYLWVLERLDQPDRAGLDETYWKTARAGLFYALSQLDAAMGKASGSDWVTLLEQEAMYEVNASRGRMLVQLWQGDTSSAEKTRAQGEQLMIRRAHSVPFEGSHLLRELPAHAFTDDLTQVKRTIESLEGMARRFPCWQPVLDYARAEFARIRGDHEGALEGLRSVHRRIDAGTHQIWAYAAVAHVKVLIALQRDDEAYALAQDYLERAEKAELGYTCHYLRMELAIAEAKLGREQDAVTRADAVIRGFLDMGATGLNLLLAHETRARVASLTNDGEAFAHHAHEVELRLVDGRSHALLAKHQRLLRTVTVSTERRHDSGPVFDPEAVEARFSDALADCVDEQERSTRMLELLLSETGASRGSLFALEEGVPTLIAECPPQALPDGLYEHARQLLESEVALMEQTATQETIDACLWTQEWQSVDADRYRPILLSHTGEKGFLVMGLAVLQLDAGADALQFPTWVATCLSRAAVRAGSCSHGG